MTTACAAQPPPGRGRGHKPPSDDRTAGATGIRATCWASLPVCQLPVVVSMTFNAPVSAASPKTS